MCKEKKKKEERRIMPSLVATTSASARTMFVRMHNVRAHTLSSHQNRIGQNQNVLGLETCNSVPILKYLLAITKIHKKI